MILTLGLSISHTRLREIAPTLLRADGTADLTTHPEHIRPPAWMCAACRAHWIAWRDYTRRDGGLGGVRHMSLQSRSRDVIAEQRALRAAICLRHHAAEVDA